MQKTMNLRYVDAYLCIYFIYIYKSVYICISTVHIHAVDSNRLQVFCLFCRTSVARFVFWQGAEQSPFLLLAHLLMGFKYRRSGFFRAIIIAVKWSWSLVISTFHK